MRRTPPDQNLPLIVMPPWRTPSAPGMLDRISAEYGGWAGAIATICDLASQLVTHLANRRAFASAFKALADAKLKYGTSVQSFWTQRLKELGEFDNAKGFTKGLMTAMDWLGPIASGFSEIAKNPDASPLGTLWHGGAAAGLDVAMGLPSATIKGFTVDIGGGTRIAAVDSLVGVLFPGANPSAVIKSSLEIAPGLVAGYAQAAFTSNTSKGWEVHQRSLNGEFGPVFQAASGLGDALHGDFRGVTKFDDEVYNGKHGAALALVSSATRGFDGLAHFDELSRNGSLGWFAGKCNETGQIVADVIDKPKILGNLVFGW